MSSVPTRDLTKLYNGNTKQLFQSDRFVRFPVMFSNHCRRKEYEYEDDDKIYVIEKTELRKEGDLEEGEMSVAYYLPNEFAMDLFIALQAKVCEDHRGRWVAKFDSLNELYTFMGKAPQHGSAQKENITNALINWKRTELYYRGKFYNREKGCRYQDEIYFGLITSFMFRRRFGKNWSLRVTFDPEYIDQILLKDTYHSLNTDTYFSLSGYSKTMYRWLASTLYGPRRLDTKIHAEKLLGQLGNFDAPSLEKPGKRRKAIERWIEDINNAGTERFYVDFKGDGSDPLACFSKGLRKRKSTPKSKASDRSSQLGSWMNKQGYS